MAAQKTITINGKLYDAVTGLPVTGSAAQSTPKTTAPKPASKPTAKKTVAGAKPSPAVKPAVHTPAGTRSTPALAVHGSTVQKSKTLVRRAAKKPAAPQKIVRRAQPGRHMDIARSTNVSKFAPHPVVKQQATAPAPVAKKPTSADKPARVHPTAKRALQKAHTKKQAQLKAAKVPTSKEVKDAEIAKALAAPKPKAKKAPKNKWVKRLGIAGLIVLTLLVVLFAVYKFIPSVSVNIAAAQAGIEARYPDYTPDGFSLHQPVTFTDGEVNLQFHSNSNDTSYSINQKRSSWDSSAVLDNVVIPTAGENYTTTKERGLTIYTYEKGAAWANGGILYVISGNAALSGDQIRRLATSL